MSRPYAMRYSRFEAIEDYLRQGWIVAIPNKAMHHHHYGVELAWLCACPVPGGFKYDRVNRVPHTSKAESAEHDSQHRT